jgi:hypothetical protein
MQAVQVWVKMPVIQAARQAGDSDHITADPNYLLIEDSISGQGPSSCR